MYTRTSYTYYRPVRWDEWIRWDSPRLAPFRSRTVHSSGSGGGNGPSYASPTPVTSALQAPLTGAPFFVLRACRVLRLHIAFLDINQHIILVMLRRGRRRSDDSSGALAHA